ncbi:MAG: hypothetical protein LBQ64_04010 [Bacteroidales bacterium]|jgi:type VI protein secretion system component VasK|nr:hypothetical protein [Bacteroidales bacterium]
MNTIVNNHNKSDLQEETTLVRTAKKRVGFKIHFVLYILSCLLIWLFWFFIFKDTVDLHSPALRVCIFITLVWLICIIAHYLFVYKWNKNYIEKEIVLLKKQKEKAEKELADCKEKQEQELL